MNLYISATDDSISNLLAQDAEDGTQTAVYDLSRLLNDAEIRYTPIEKLCLSLFHACTKLEYYLLPREVTVMCKINIVKYLLNWPVLQRKLTKWTIKLNAFALKYVPLRAIKGQAIADFLAEHPYVDIQDPMDNCQRYVHLEPWILAFNGSKHQNRVGATIVITSSNAIESEYICSLGLQCSNNQVEYQALILGLRLVLSMDAKVIKILGDS